MTAALPPSVQSVRLAEGQNWRCAYCGFPMLTATGGAEEIRAVIVCEAAPRSGRDRRAAIMYRRVTKDHVETRAAGGSDGVGNKVAACRWCNEFRGSAPVEHAYDRIRRLVRLGRHPHQVYAATGRFPSLCPIRAIGASPAIGASA